MSSRSIKGVTVHSSGADEPDLEQNLNQTVFLVSFLCLDTPDIFSL